MENFNEKEEIIHFGTRDLRINKNCKKNENELSREDRMRNFRNKKISSMLNGRVKNIFYFKPIGSFIEDFENLKQILQHLFGDQRSPYSKELVELLLWTYELVVKDRMYSCYDSEVELIYYLRSLRSVSNKPDNFNYKSFFRDLAPVTDIKKYPVIKESFFDFDSKYTDFNGILMDLRSFLSSQFRKAEKFVLDNKDFINENILLQELEKLLDEYKSLDKENKSIISLSKDINEEQKIAVKFLKEHKLNDIYKKLDDFVYKQDAAKESVSLMLYNHMVRMANPTSKLNKNNYLMVGPTGCGKTEITRALKEISPVPVVQIDCGNITGTGWSGANFGDAVKSELEGMTPEEKELIKYGIFVLDEADKMLFGADDDKEGWWKCRQSSLLKILEDGKILDKDGNIVLDSSEVVFILAGAFSGMFDDDTFTVGISPLKNKKNKENRTFSMLEVSNRIMKYGMMPELAGRVSNLILLNKLNVEDYCHILKNYKKSSVINQQQLYKLSNLKIVVTDEAIIEAANQAYERGHGVRGADGVLGSAIERAAYKALIEGKKSVRVTKKMLTNIEISV